MTRRRRASLRLAAVIAMTWTTFGLTPSGADAKPDPREPRAFHSCWLGGFEPPQENDDGLVTDLVHHYLEPYVDGYPADQSGARTGPLHGLSCFVRNRLGL